MLNGYQSKRLRNWRLTCGAFGLALLIGMGGVQTLFASGTEKKTGLKLVASNSFIGELCEALVGDDADIRVLMPRGLNPHSYQPSPRDLAAIKDADRVFIIGGIGDLGKQIEDAFQDLDHVILVPIVGYDYVDELIMNHGEHGGFNQHLWFSPQRMMAGIQIIAASLSDANPERSEIYTVRENEYLRRLSLLDAQVRESLMDLEEEDKRLVVDHPFLDYYARDYGFEIVGHIVDSDSDHAEPSAREISELVNLLKEDDIKAIFISDSAGKAMRSLVEAVVFESGRDIRIVELLAGSLAPIGRRGSNYFDFITYNTELIVGALGGE